jgi:hypothetical protein
MTALKSVSKTASVGPEALMPRPESLKRSPDGQATAALDFLAAPTTGSPNDGAATHAA